MATTPAGPPSNDDLNDSAQNLKSVLGDLTAAINQFPSATKEMSKAMKEVTSDFKTSLELVDDLEEKIKLIAQTTRTIRKGIIDSKDAKKSLEYLQEIIDAQEMIQKKLVKGSKAYSDSLKITKEIQAHMEKIKSETERVEKNFNDLRKEGEKYEDTLNRILAGPMKELNKALMVAESDTAKMVKNFRTMSVGHLTRQMQGISKVYETMGIGKGHAAKVEKYAKFAEIPYKMQQAQAARLGANKEAWEEKRTAALKAVQAEYGGSMADPKLQQILAKRMGVKGLGKADLAALAGEGEMTGTVAGLATHGTGAGGVMSKVATTMENSMGSLGEVIGGLAPLLAAVEEGLGFLVAAFDSYVKQNKTIEAGLAAGGLFGAKVGPGGAFGGAREALVPNELRMGVYSDLGITFERNLKIAQTMAESGANIAQMIDMGRNRLMTGERGPRSAGGEFGPGGFGEIQRAVVGAGRLAGMTDAQGVQQILKMLEQYQETLEQSEDFFIKLRKDTAAAGISASKYISILDEVLGRFDRMNKSLDQSVAVLGELSKTGRLSSEDLRQYFDFLSGGAGAKERTGSATQMFLYGQMSQGEKQEAADRRRQAYEREVGKAPQAFAGLGIDVNELQQGLSVNASNADVQKFLNNRVTQAINNSGMDPQQKQSMNAMVNRLSKQRQDVELWNDFAAGRMDIVGMGQAQKVGGTTLLDRMDLQRKAFDFAMQSGNFQEFLTNPQKFSGEHKAFASIAGSLGMKPEELGTAVVGLQKRAAEERVGEAKLDPKKANELFKELHTKGIKIDIKGSTAYKKYLDEHGNELIQDVMGLTETTKYWGQVAAKGQDEADEAARQKTLDEAREVARRTQSTADIMANAFSKWFTEIISGIEFIVEWLNSFRMFGGGMQPLTRKDRDAITSTMEENTQKMDTLTRRAEDLRNSHAQGADMQASLLEKQVSELKTQNQHLEGLMSLGKAQSESDKELLDEVRKNKGITRIAGTIGPEAAPDVSNPHDVGAGLRGGGQVPSPNVPITGVNATGMVAAHAPTGAGTVPAMVVNHQQTFYSAEITQQTADSNSTGSSYETDYKNHRNAAYRKSTGELGYGE